MDRMHRDELAINTARVFAQLFQEYRGADPAVREVVEQMSETADVAPDRDDREMALVTLADALGLLGPLRPAGDASPEPRAPDMGPPGDGAGPPWQDES